MLNTLRQLWLAIIAVFIVVLVGAYLNSANAASTVLQRVPVLEDGGKVTYEDFFTLTTVPHFIICVHAPGPIAANDDSKNFECVGELDGNVTRGIVNQPAPKEAGL